MTTHKFELTVDTDVDVLPDHLYELVLQTLQVGQIRAAGNAGDDTVRGEARVDALIVRGMQTTLRLIKPLPGAQEAYDQFRDAIEAVDDFNTNFWMDELDRIRANIACALQARLLTHEQSGKLLARVTEIHNNKLKGD